MTAMRYQCQVHTSHRDGTDKLMVRLLQGPATSLELRELLHGRIDSYLQNLAAQLKLTKFRISGRWITFHGRLMDMRVKRYRLVRR